MIKYKFYIGRFCLVILLLSIIWVVCFIILSNISKDRLVETKESSYKIGKLLQIPEDRIKYVSSYNLNDSAFSVRAIIDDKYYVSCLRIGYLDVNKSLSNIVKISKKYFSKSEQEGYLTSTNYLFLPVKGINNPYSLLFNSKLLPTNIETIGLYIGGDNQQNFLSDRKSLEIVTIAKNISFSFNGDNQEEMIFKSFYGAGEYKTNIIISTDNENNIYIICLSPMIDMDIVEKKVVMKAPFKTLKELREESN